MRIFLILLVTNSFGLFSQAISWNKFIPTGYDILDTAKGDLNQDGIIDGLLILKHKEEAIDTFATPLLIIHGLKDGSFILAERNDHIVQQDHYTDISITKNCFSINQYGGFYLVNDKNEVYGYNNWDRKTTFKYNGIKKEYFLYKDTRAVHPACGECIDVKYTHEKYNSNEWNKTKFKDYVVEL